MRRPLLHLLTAFITGIIAGSYFKLSLNLLLTLTIVALLFVPLSIRKKWSLTAFVFLAGLIFLLGFFNIQKQTYFFKDDLTVLNYINGGKVTVEGIVKESPVSYQEKDVLAVRCIRILKDKSYLPTAGIIRLAIPPDLNFRYGDFIRFQSHLRKIQNFNNPGRFDYERCMNLQGIYVSGYVNDASEIVLLRKNNAGDLRLKLESFRQHLKKIIVQNSFSPAREVLEAMTLGNQNEIPAEIRDNFSKTGTSHILSISGLHVGMVVVTSFFLIFLLLKSSEWMMLKFNIIKIAAATAFLMVLLYALIAGMGVTVVRATLMALFFLLALLFGKQKDFYNTLALAGLIILTISPEALFDISFQLSFASVLAIIYIVPRLNCSFFDNRSVLPLWLKSVMHYIQMTVVVCIAATLGTLPLIIYYFDRVSLVTIFANLIVVPLLGTLTLSVAMFFILFSFSPTLSGFFIQLASFLTQISINVINHLANLSWSSISVAKPNLAEIALFYLMLFLFFQLLDHWKNKKGDSLRYAAIKYLLIMAFFISVADMVYFSVHHKLSSDLKITFIDVGQGNSAFVQLPGGETMLIDGGGFSKSSFDIGKSVIAPFLYAKRINKIDTVILTHPHPDHLSGLIYILNNFNVRNVWKTELPVDPVIFPQWERTVTAHQIKTLLLSDQFPEQDIHGVQFKVLWPPDDLLRQKNDFSYDDVNDASLVLKISFGKISFLLPGDISTDIEQRLIQSGVDLQSDVLMLPHHGSIHSNSTDFIEAVSCRYAVVSAGKSNVFRHPHPAVLHRYKNAKAEIFRTDQDGAISFITNGNNLRVHKFLQNL
jgi:competence protein ComEC